MIEMKEKKNINYGKKKWSIRPAGALADFQWIGLCQSGLILKECTQALKPIKM